MAEKTLTWISDLDDYRDQHGNGYINMAFDDETVAYKGTKDVESVHAELSALLDQPGDYFLEDTGKTTKAGKPKMKLVGWPGHAPPENSGNGSRLTTSSQAPETMLRSVALKAAVHLATAPDVAIEIAEKFLTWLSAGTANADGPAGGVAGATPPASSSGPVGVGGSTSAGPDSTCKHEAWQPTEDGFVCVSCGKAAS